MNHAKRKRLEIKGRKGGRLFPVGNSFLLKTGSIFPFSRKSCQSSRNPRNRNRFREIAAAIMPSVFPCFSTLSPVQFSQAFPRVEFPRNDLPRAYATRHVESFYFPPPSYPCQSKQSKTRASSRIVQLGIRVLIRSYGKAGAAIERRATGWRKVRWAGRVTPYPKRAGGRADGQPYPTAAPEGRAGRWPQRDRDSPPHHTRGTRGGTWLAAGGAKNDLRENQNLNSEIKNQN